jgi:hypothetical protein
MTEKVKYNHELLTKFCSDNNITLLKDYSNENNENDKLKSKTGPKPRVVNRDTKIEGICAIDGCENSFIKPFRDLIEKNGYCRQHGVEDANKKREETCLLERGYRHVSQCPDVKNKGKKTCLEKHGVENPLQSKEIREKGKETMLKTLGVENPSQSKQIIELKKQNSLSKGKVKYENTFLDSLLKKNNATTDIEYDEITLGRESEITFKCCCGKECTKIYRVIEMYGAFCEKCQAIHGKEQSIETNMKNRGVPHSMQDPSVIEKVKLSNFERWGGHPMHNAEIAEKALKNSLSKKVYTYPSGRNDNIQGYENWALDELLKNDTPEEDIITGRKEVPEIRYIGEDGKEHRYYVDIYIPSQNKCIEVKSTYTYDSDNVKVLLKQKAVKDAGYLCEIWIYNDKGEKLECIL